MACIFTPCPCVSDLKPLSDLIAVCLCVPAVQTGGAVHVLPQTAGRYEAENPRLLRASLPGQDVRRGEHPGRAERASPRGAMSVLVWVWNPLHTWLWRIRKPACCLTFPSVQFTSTDILPLHKQWEGKKMFSLRAQSKKESNWEELKNKTMFLLPVDSIMPLVWKCDRSMHFVKRPFFSAVLTNKLLFFSPFFFFSLRAQTGNYQLQLSKAGGIHASVCQRRPQLCDGDAEQA